jgi:peptide/nickel transport system ATP-binding protein
LLLQIKNLHVSFTADGKKNKVVNELNIAVAKGKMLAIVGESGSGKSISALSILQLLPTNAVVEGQIIFTINQHEPIEITALSPKQITALRGNKIAMIFQEPMTALNPLLTCGNQVDEVLQLHLGLTKKEAKNRTIELFIKVQLPQPTEMYHRFPHQLSGGQKQRVMIAMAISCNPALLIADEPTTALDVTVQHAILTLLQQLQITQQMAVLLITHDLGVVADYTNDIAIMYKGQIVEYGNTKQILQQPQHNYTKALLACRPIGHARGSILPVVSDFLKDKSTEKSVLQKNQTIPQPANQITTDQPALVVENLLVHYAIKSGWWQKEKHPFKAVDDVSFIVPKGKIIGLVGESGCGKTTVGRAILQLIQPIAGKIIVNGIDTTLLNSNKLRQLRKELQIVFQDPYGSLNPRLTIGDAIQEPLLVHDIGLTKQQQKDRVIELLESVHLSPDHFNRFPHQFSGGQRQRICIARALALHPSFLIFDESVSALDVSVQAQVLNLLNELKRTFGFSAIFISHDLSVVKYISDEILVMYQGKIIEHGPADEVYHHPKQLYTQQLIDAIPGKNLQPVFR